jgi:hypothetical protein
MAKAKRERRTSIRTLPTDGSLSALDALERAEQRSKESAAAQDSEGDGKTPQSQEGSEER